MAEKSTKTSDGPNNIDTMCHKNNEEFNIMRQMCK